MGRVGTYGRLTGRVSCLVAVATVAACGWSVDATSPAVSSISSRVVSPRFVVVVPDTHARLLGSRHFSDSDVGFLIGPHRVLRQQSTGVVTEIGAGDATKLGLSGAIKAPPGHEFVVADFATNVGYQQQLPNHGRQPGSLDGTNYRVWVRIGKTTRSPQLDVRSGALLIVCAPTKARVRLEFRDGRRTQALDLRTGRRVKDAVSEYYPTQDWSPRRPEPSWRTHGVTGSGVVVTQIDRVDVYLSPFAPGGHWARRGQAWLYVTERLATSCGRDVAWCRTRLDPRKRFRLRVPRDPDPEPVGSPFRTAAWGTDQPGETTVGFEVPASLRSATLVTSTAGQVRIKRKSAKHAVRTAWRNRPEPVRIRLRPRA